MKKIYAFAVCALLVLFSITGARTVNPDDHKAHWEYEGKNGPEHWGELSHEFETCSKGKNQSPIDLSSAKAPATTGVTFNYQASALNLVNNGHTIQFNYDPGSSIAITAAATASKRGVSADTYTLKQFHFHAPSEHTINGKSYPMEVHFVHQNASGNLAVVGVMIEKGSENQALAQAWKNLPQKADQKLSPGGKLAALDILPSQGRGVSFYNYPGSLTTPPCSEGVNWFVMGKSIQMSEDQIHQFEKLFHKSNRPVQPLNGRTLAQGALK